MPRVIAPIENFATAAINTSLHGRSVYRSEDTDGHDVFKGWDTWRTNGHRGIGDALDIGGLGWRTPVVAVCDGVQTVFRNDTSKLEVVYIEGGGVIAVYAHVNARFEATGVAVKQGDVLGVVRGDLSWPHLHFELWVDGAVVAAQTPEALRAKMLGLFAVEAETDVKVIYPPDAGAAGVVPCAPELVNGKLRGNLAEFAGALGFEVVWNAAQRKGYVRKRDA